MLDPKGTTLRVLPEKNVTFDHAGERYIRRTLNRLELVDAGTDSVIEQVAVKSSEFHQVVFRGADYAVASGIRGIRQWHFAIGAAQSRRLQWITPAEIWYLVSAVAAVAFVWAVGWVRQGTRSDWEHRAMADVVIFNSINIGALLLRLIWIGANNVTSYPEIPILLGSLGGIVALGAIWLMMGRQRLSGRLPYFLLVLAVGWGCLLVSVQNELPVAGVIGAAALLVTLIGC